MGIVSPRDFRTCTPGESRGGITNLSKAELKLWTLRMLVDMGVLDPVEVERRPLPDELPEDAPEHLRETYHAIVRVLSLRYLFGRELAPLTHKFLAQWTGLPEYAVSKCMRWLLKHFYLQGGVFLRKDGTFSKTREDKMQPEYFAMNLEAKAWKPKGKTFIQRSRVEWAKFYAEKRAQESWEEVACAEYEEAVDRGDCLEPDDDQDCDYCDYDDYVDYDDPELDDGDAVDGDFDEEPVEEEVLV
jgi:hypothetical protein